MLYFFAGLIGFILAYVLITRPSKLESDILAYVARGSRVVISIDADAYIFELKENKIVITRGVSDYNPAPLDTGGSNAIVVDDVGNT